MIVLNSMGQMVLADFRERTRRYSFLIMLLGTFFFGFLVITGKYTIRLGEYRGEYNSAWVGSLMASAGAIMLGFFGFYLVKNSLSRDRNTGVGQILASTRLGNFLYMATKFVSNFAVLGFITAVLVIAAVVMQLLGRVPGGFDLWALVAPFLFVCPPVLALVAAAAILFESVKWLRGTVGNVLYFFIAEAVFLIGIFLNVSFLDLSGLGTFIPSMEESALLAYPGADLGIEVGFVGFVESDADQAMNLFRWNGIDWSIGMVPLRLLRIVAALLLVGLATLKFDRFDPAGVGRVDIRKRRKKQHKKRSKVADTPEVPALSKISWSRIAPVELDFSFIRMLKAELRLMLKGYHWSWYAIAVGLVAAQLALPYYYARSLALPAAWIWPLPLWSAMGTREARFSTGELLFSSVSPVSRQFPAVWAAGLTIAVLTGSGMMIRAALAGDLGHVGMLFVGALFVTTLALATGTLSGTRKLFEIVYLMIWYIGPINRLPQLDFLGATGNPHLLPTPTVYLAMSLAFILVAFLMRGRQVVVGRG
jgi:hypothetical protein